MEENLNSQESSRLSAGPSTVIPVVQEHMIVDKEVVETAKVMIRKRVREHEETVNVPLLQEGYDVEHVPVNRIVDKIPPAREEGNVVIIPIVREVLVMEKKYEVVEEVRIVKKTTEVPHIQQITLRREEVTVERIPTAEDGRRPR